jgi:hypothetical protein
MFCKSHPPTNHYFDCLIDWYFNENFKFKMVKWHKFASKCTLKKFNLFFCYYYCLFVKYISLFSYAWILCWLIMWLFFTFYERISQWTYGSRHFKKKGFFDRVSERLFERLLGLRIDKNQFLRKKNWFKRAPTRSVSKNVKIFNVLSSNDFFWIKLLAKKIRI